MATKRIRSQGPRIRPAAAKRPAAKAKATAASKPAGPKTTGGWTKPIEVYKDSKVTILSAVPVTHDQAVKLASRVEDAYSFDTQTMKWGNTGDLNKPVTVTISDDKAFTKKYGSGTSGITLDADHFEIPSSVVVRESGDDADTFAHELGHVQDYREGGKRLRYVPAYLQEGKSYILGAEYTASRNLLNSSHKSDRDEVAKLTGSQARAVVAHFRSGAAETRTLGNKLYRDELAGALFVEFLRTRLGGSGSADAMSRLANLDERVKGGATYDQAFQQEFGVSGRNAEAQFVKYVTDTEGEPAERLRGTIYAS